MSTNTQSDEKRDLIQDWLLEEGFKIRTLPTKETFFNLVVEDSSGLKFQVVQPLTKKDQIVIITNATIPKDRQQKLDNIENRERNRFLWNLRFGLLNMGIAFQNISLPLKKIQVSTPIYYDGLTKTAFMNAVFNIKRAMVFIFWTFDREFGEPKTTSDLGPMYS